jgi:hypothetical protein
MGSMAFKQAAAAWDAVAEHASEATELCTTGQRIDQLERIETLERILPAMRQELINQLAATATAQELGGSLSHALADGFASTAARRPGASMRPKTSGRAPR